MTRLVATGYLLLLACSYPVPALVLVPALRDSPLLGCWSLAAPGIDPLFLAPPGGVRLVDSAVATTDGSIETLVLHVGAGIRRGRLPPRASWQFVTRDSVHMYWGDGFVGFTAAVSVHGDSLYGHGYTYSDVVGAEPPPSKTIVGHRIACADAGL